MKPKSAEFVVGAAGPQDFPRDGVPQIAFVGRSNVGKASLINALVRRDVARTSAAPGKTREANVYRVGMGPALVLYLVDLPGYGYARGGTASRRAFDALARAYFAQAPRAPGGDPPVAGVVLAVDARHPGLANDLEVWGWIAGSGVPAAAVATKIDALGRQARTRAIAAHGAALKTPVLGVSAHTGEGLDELWKLIVRLSRRDPPPPPR
jgi:GTP-binding protein